MKLSYSLSLSVYEHAGEPISGAIAPHIQCVKQSRPPQICPSFSLNTMETSTQALSEDWLVQDALVVIYIYSTISLWPQPLLQVQALPEPSRCTCVVIYICSTLSVDSVHYIDMVVG